MGLGYVVPSFALEITTTVCPFFRPLPSSSSSSCSSSSSSFSSFAIFSLASRSLSLGFSVSCSLFLCSAIHARIYIYTRIQGQGCSICKIAEYGRKMQAACMPIWRAWLPRFFLSRPPSLVRIGEQNPDINVNVAPEMFVETLLDCLSLSLSLSLEIVR